MGYMDRRSSRRDNKGCCGCGCFGGCVGLLVALGGVAAVLILGVYWWATSTPKPPRPNYTPNAVEAQNFENKIQTASSSASRSGVFNVTVTEGEASSWLTLRAPAVVNSSLPLENMQVIFRNERAQVYGELDTGIGMAGVLIGFDLRVNNDGKLQVEIDSIDAGGISVPGAVRDELNNQIQSIIEGEIRDLGSTADYTITSLRVSDGQLAIRGTKP